MPIDYKKKMKLSKTTQNDQDNGKEINWRNIDDALLHVGHFIDHWRMDN